MAGLVAYGSSDEEDNQEETVRPTHVFGNGPPALPRNGTRAPLADERSSNPVEPLTSNGATAELAEAPLLGPSMGPSEESYETPIPESDINSAPQSPYTSDRSLIRSLTLPSNPSYDLPPSPPGSPLASTNSKFTQFLALQKRGIHFNEKLANSSAMKNPGLFEKLMDFAEIGEAEQYATTLPKEVWDPTAVPEWAWKEELGKSQQKITKQREEEKAKGEREKVDFVPAVGSREGSRSGTPSGSASRTGQRSAAERVMAGLEGGRSNSPLVQGQKRKSRFGPDVNG